MSQKLGLFFPFVSLKLVEVVTW